VLIGDAVARRHSRRQKLQRIVAARLIDMANPPLAAQAADASSTALTPGAVHGLYCYGLKLDRLIASYAGIRPCSIESRSWVRAVFSS
jgi:hypothetical protein